MATHVANERVVLMDAYIFKHDMGASKISDTDYYKYSTLGRGEPLSVEITLTFTAAANKPYSPAHAEITRDPGTGEFTITWTRRTRIGAATLNGQDVPVGETYELYRCKILDPYTGATVRTIEVEDPVAYYTDAEQTADWGELRTSLNVEIVQMSPALSIEGYPTDVSY